jgi:hypothetical protein
MTMDVTGSLGGNLVASYCKDRSRRVSWTCRLWFKNTSDYSVQIVNRGGWGIQQRHTGQVQFDFGATSVTGLVSHSIGTWNHVVFGRHAGGNYIFLQVNGGVRQKVDVLHFGNDAIYRAIDTEAATVISGEFGADGTGAGRMLYLDELGFWNGRVWSSDLAIADCAAGVGVGYADSPLRPTAYWTMDEFTSSGPNVLTDEVAGHTLTADTVISAIDTGKVAGCLTMDANAYNLGRFRGVSGDFSIGGE